LTRPMPIIKRQVSSLATQSIIFVILVTNRWQVFKISIIYYANPTETGPSSLFNVAVSNICSFLKV
jgi:hypothetical protein